MRLLIAIILIVKFELISGQTFNYPKIKSEGLKIEEFIPTGWTILDSIGGDLNSDNLRDLVVIIQYKDSVTISKFDEGYTDTVTTQPRILLILFGDHTGKRYVLNATSNTFILNHDNPSQEDPYQSISIHNGILQITFKQFYNMGSWFVTNSIYKFRYQDKKFFLIGAENNSYHRATLDYENYSYNFLTKKWSKTSGNENSGNKPKIEWHSLPLIELKTLSTFEKPYTWEVTKNVFL